MNKPLPRVIRVLEGTSVDGPGLRTSIYFSGCRHQCPGCHNPHTWDYTAGSETSIEELLACIDYNENNVTFSGGDPMYQALAIIPLAKAIKERGYNIWCYTGFLFEELLGTKAPEGSKELLQYIDVLVDGPFIMAQKNSELRFRGSENQRIIEVHDSLAKGSVVLWKQPL
ncbi:MAG: anaerobic ribonucleoside-triphosphate reductase activating protein [Muribaculaceae bacterium]|nr:anaerobic ribonucleoside-triphosphate reductase activating protein [Muribaculaceae bacterium]